MATRKTRTRKVQQKMAANIKCPPPYEWLPDALERYTDDSGWTRAQAICHLLDTGLGRDLTKLRALRLMPAGRGLQGDGRSEAPLINAYSTPGEYSDLDKRILVACDELRTQHIERAREALKKLVRDGLVEDSQSVRGWRWRNDDRDGLLVQFTKKGLPEQVVRDACDYMTDDMSVSDVRRAILAAELESEGYAPKSWAKPSVSINIGTPLFKERELR